LPRIYARNIHAYKTLKSITLNFPNISVPIMNFVHIPCKASFLDIYLPVELFINLDPISYI